MTYKVFAFYDRVSNTYGEPFLAPSEAVAQRRFQYVMKNAPMVAEDSQLFVLGEYSVETGCIFGLEKPAFVCNYSAEIESK